jgi:hypothetical protein
MFFPTAENEQCFQFHMPIPEDQANSMNWGNLIDAVLKERLKMILVGRRLP